MLKLLWLIPALPCAGFLTLAFFGPRLSRRAVALIGPGVVLASAVVSWSVAMSFFLAPPPGGAFVQELWTWMDVAGFHPKMALYLDPLSLVMMLVVTSVGFLIHWYSTEFMAEDEGYSRFFAYMNLFVASMLLLGALVGAHHLGREARSKPETKTHDVYSDVAGSDSGGDLVRAGSDRAAGAP